MKIPKERYNEIIVALDGIRCDNRENKQYTEDESELRKMPDDIMQYIERKGYCKYIYGANCRFVRTLTEKGYEVLIELDYSKYQKKKAIENYKSWIPIYASIAALLISGYVAWFKPSDSKFKTETDQKLNRLDSLSSSITDSINSVNLRLNTELTSTKHFLDSLITAMLAEE